PLLLAERELPDARARIDGEAVAPREIRHAPLDRVRVQEKRPADVAVVAEHDVLRNRERVDEPKVLMHHRDAGVERVTGRVELDRISPQPDLTLVRPVQPGEDVGQRRLAGAVLAEQRVYLAGSRLEVDVLVRDDSGEPLRDSPQRDRRRRRGGLRLPPGTISPWRYRSRPWRARPSPTGP